MTINKHDHLDYTCKHENLKFCKHCNIPHCLNCGKEWREAYKLAYTSTVPFNGTLSGNGIYSNNLLDAGSLTVTTSGNTQEKSVTSCKHAESV